MDATNDQIKKALVSIAVESTLLELGQPVLEKVEHALNNKYNCHIPDCYEHPEYLKTVLKELYGTSYSNIINSIRKALEEFSAQEPIAIFLKEMNEQ